MLVQKKQDYIYEQESETVLPKPKLVRKANTRLRVKCLLLVVLVAAMAAVTTVQSAITIQAGYDLVKVKSEVAKIEKENELLRLDIAKLKSPQRIEEFAMKNLGMVVPKNAYYATTMPEAIQAQPVSTDSNRGMAEKLFSAIKVNTAEASIRR